MPENKEKKTVYQLMTDKAFIGFNDYLISNEFDFEDVMQDVDRFNITLTGYVHWLEWHLVDWYEDYKDAD